jgi:hypothetical protein
MICDNTYLPDVNITPALRAGRCRVHEVPAGAGSARAEAKGDRRTAGHSELTPREP